MRCWDSSRCLSVVTIVMLTFIIVLQLVMLVWRFIHG